MRKLRNKAVCRLKRSPDGNVTGEIVGHDGTILSSQNFGKFSDSGYERLMELIQLQNLEITIIEIDVAGN